MAPRAADVVARVVPNAFDAELGLAPDHDGRVVVVPPSHRASATDELGGVAVAVEGTVQAFRLLDVLGAVIFGRSVLCFEAAEALVLTDELAGVLAVASP